MAENRTPFAVRRTPSLVWLAGPPLPGETWDLTLDATGHAPGVATLEGRALPSSGTILGGGELLIDVTSALVARRTVPHTGGPTPLSLALPPDAALCGRTASFQGLVFGLPGPRLGNALDVTVGAP